MESRLVEDTRQYLAKLAPRGLPYLHDDIHLRFPPDDDRWRGSVDEWRAQEPVNAQAHLLSMLLGNSVCVPVVDSELALGPWQSLIFIELDGSRVRTCGIQVLGE